jgi:hypothetical protein
VKGLIRILSLLMIIYFNFSHIINDVAFNNNGETLAVASGNPQLRFLDRQGKQWSETVRGFLFIRFFSVKKKLF